VAGHLENSVQVVGIPKVGSFAAEGTAGAERTEVEIGHRVGLRRVVVKHMAVGKLPQAANTALVKMIHNPHLVVKRHMWLGEQYRERRSVNTVSLRSEM
jgi:hypothetical protein